jgi:PleD family two-component response regulator
MERDELTGLYNKDTFFRRAAEILQSNPDKSYTLIVTMLNALSW